MVELNLSLRSVEARVTQFEASSERNALAVQVGNRNAQTSLLNNQQQQIIDEIGISQEAVQQFEEAQVLADQLRQYTDYLNGRDNAPTNIQITATTNDNEPDVTIASRSSRLAASVTVVSVQENTLDVHATFDDVGNLTELSIDRTSISAEYVRAEFITEQRSFFSQA